MSLKPIRCLALPVLLLLTTVVGCKTERLKQTVQYEFLHYERTGKQQIDMRIYPGMDRGKLRVLVSSCDFQPIGKSIILVVNGETADTFDDFYHTLDRSIDPISNENLNAKTSTEYPRMRLMHGSKAVEISNVELLERFQQVEEVVRPTLQP